MKKLLLIFACSIFSISISNAQWQQTSGTVGCYTHHITCLFSNDSNLFAGTNKGIFISANNGTSWKAISNGLSTGSYDTSITCLIASGSNLFAGASYGGFFFSKNSGANWTKVNSGLNPPFVSSLVFIGSNLFAGMSDYGGGVFLSGNNGTNWKQVNAGLNNFNKNIYINAVAAIGNNLFAGNEYGGVFLSTDNGTSWTRAGLDTFSIHTFGISGNNLFAGTNGGVFLSNNNGASWTQVNNGLTNLNIYTFCISGNNLFVGTAGGGVFLSNNDGASWTTFNSGLNYFYISALAVHGNNLFAGVGGCGVFVCDLNNITTTIKKNHNNDLQASIYPNPANAEFFVTSNTTENQLLQVFDVTGKLMHTETLQNGRSTIDASNFAQGVYNICISSNKERMNRPLVIVR